MKLQIVETKESDGNWIKVYLNGECKACYRLGETASRSRDEAVAEAEEMFQFILENGDNKKILKEYETVYNGK